LRSTREAALSTALEDDDEAALFGGETRIVVLAPDEAGGRLDKTLASRLEGVSRARLQALIAEGALRLGGRPLTDPAARTAAGEYRLIIPPPAPAEPLPESIALSVLYEDDALIVVDKPAGMAVHPAPGSETGTLVNALLAHCGGSLAGVGGVARPGIVHRLDKDTSGVIVAAKTDAAHAGLSALFARHDIDRIYVALVRGAPEPAYGTITTQLGRSPHDRKKMAVLRSGGREAITHYRTEARFGPARKPLASKITCTLETGRTHQIRVHLASKGAPVLADPVYGAGAPAAAVKAAIEASGLTRQALHAAVLGFRHPITGVALRFDSPPPADMEGVLKTLQRFNT
jgi:23S rRNA pseudouridine1911/1915/1917 synthase